MAPDRPAATAMPAPVTPAPPAPAAVNGTDISGKWVGSWVGNGLFNAPRQENLILEIAQKGDAGYGRMIIDNAVAAESVPWEVRQQGLGGIRVFAEVNGPQVKSLYFDFDKAVLRPDAVDTLSNNVTWLKENADTFVLIEGNADERGTAEYNLALGDRRAKSALDYLEANGIAKNRMSTVSYGKERPACTDATEECRAQNRRSDFHLKSK